MKNDLISERENRNVTAHGGAKLEEGRTEGEATAISA